MSRLLVLTTLTVTVACVATFSPLSGQSAVGAETPVQKDPKIERGRYLAHDVALCVYCHSPRTASGDIIRTRLFEGAPIPVGSPVGQEWATAAPNLKSIAEIWGEKDLITFLKTGVPPRGVPPRLPMPPFRMNDEDASAVAAYLRSLR